MGREINRLSARRVATLTEPGRHADGGNLYLVVDPSGAKRWVFLYRFAGKRREMGLGPLNAVPLLTARERAAEARASVAAGIDPITAKERPTAPAKTFGDVAEAYMADRQATWRNEQHRWQWRQTLEKQAADVWAKPVANVTTEDVLAVLRPIWHVKSETARRLRGRIERVLDSAIAQKLRPNDNPARWKGHLDAVLPRTSKLQRGHHPALPYAQLPAFFVDLSARSAPAAAALRFVILTAARSGEVRGMTWAEVGNDVWTVPAERMKGRRVHRVPLSTAALAALPARGEPHELVFPSATGRKQSDMAFNMLLRRMKHLDISTHGFRSTFRDWVDAETDFPGDLAEAALAHLVGDETERAYRRGDALEKRRHLMEAWARFVASASGADVKARSIES